MGPKSNDVHPYKRRAERDLRHGRRRSREDRAKVEGTQRRKARGCQKLEEARKDSPPELSEDVWLRGHLEFRLQASRAVRE